MRQLKDLGLIIAYELHGFRYTYTNYEIEKAAEDLAAVTDELAKAQTALDVVNNREQMDINI